MSEVQASEITMIVPLEAIKDYYETHGDPMAEHEHMALVEGWLRDTWGIESDVTELTVRHDPGEISPDRENMYQRFSPGLQWMEIRAVQARPVAGEVSS